MKKLSLFALAAVGLLLGACSDKDDVAQEVQNPSNFTDGAFIGVTLQLPSAKNPNTRANEDFEDGDANEFTVHNAMLYIFAGADEASAQFVGQYKIGTGEDWVKDGDTRVTSTYNKATQISNELAAEMADATNTDEYFAYVIVNNPGVDAVLTQRKKATDTTPAVAGTTFASFQAREWNLIGSPVAAEAAIGEDGLLMTNSPVCASPGGSVAAPITATTVISDATTSNYYTLVKLDKTRVFATEDAAIKAPAGCIFIERAAVKISVANTVAKVGGASGPAISFDGWQIINYPSTFYNTRKVNPAWGNLVSYITALDADGNSDIVGDDDESANYFANWVSSNQYRFVSGTAFNPTVPATGHETAYRTYFAEDPTYADDYVLNRPQADVNGTWIPMAKAGYTVENTFDVAHQTWKNTTMVTFKAIIGDGNDFYTVNGGDDMFVNTAAEGTEGDVNYVPAKTAKQNIEAYVAAEIGKLPTVKAALQAACAELAAADVAAYQTAHPGEPTPTYEYSAALTVTLKATSASKDAWGYDIDFTVTGKNADSTKDEGDVAAATGAAIIAAAEAAIPNFSVNFHEGGVAYYNARIKHFGDYETPWSATKPFATVAPGADVKQIYGYDVTKDATDAVNVLANNRFLGRYGVVRDNWYKLSIDAVKHIGTAEPVDVSSSDKGGTPDDEIENYISVHVHLIPWVIRNQSVSF